MLCKYSSFICLFIYLLLLFIYVHLFVWDREQAQGGPEAEGEAGSPMHPRPRDPDLSPWQVLAYLPEPPGAPLNILLFPHFSSICYFSALYLFLFSLPYVK